MLFVGFSLKDDNFHRIVDEVRRSVTEGEPPTQSLRPLKDDDVSAAPRVIPASPHVISASSHGIPASPRFVGAQSSSEPTSPVHPPNLIVPPALHHSPGFPRVAPLVASGAKSSQRNDYRFGTQLSLTENPATELLWTQDVHVVAMERRPVSRKGARTESFSPDAPRKLEIFLDYLLSLATSTTAFLLNPLYDALLENSQRLLRNSILKFVNELPDEAFAAQEYELIQNLLDSLGYSSSVKESILSS
jgi:hypothetical protein